ncbi:MAG: tRNA (adenosine(37)-N6)-threonylcarbamoyltransferase complex ATPase subunit type 1 TsaE [Armatimonadota bacterium]|nr:tRNA (adenosine(37)-N6)-threonylcarbamoyltransferase complex ATPase subunit type 1 TsaE [Armatimonadota bacterium]
MPASEGLHFAEITVDTASAEETRALAAELAAALSAGDFVALMGPLGAGKTVFVQGLAKGLGVAGNVTSPTFVLMRLHRGEPALCHVDAYRVNDAQELIELGIDDWRGETVLALEWADTVPEALPEERIEVLIDYTNEGRRLRLRGMGCRPARMVERLDRHEDTGD